MTIPRDAEGHEIAAKVRALMAEAPLAVLCTQADSQPYGHVVAYVFSDDLRQVAFCTPRDTRKVHEMRACDRVALVIDNRASHPDDVLRAAAITATGLAVELCPGDAWNRWRERLVARHPYLDEFMRATGAILFRVDISHILYVTQLNTVSYWVPEE